MAKKRTTSLQRHLDQVLSNTPPSITHCVTLPVTLKHDEYIGPDPMRQHRAREFNNAGRKLQAHITAAISSQEADETKIYTFAQLSDQTGLDVRVVRELCERLYCGSNGFRGYKSAKTPL